MTKTPFSINSFEDDHLAGYIWQPDSMENLNGIVVISHGMAEVIERYDAFCMHLCEKNFVIYGVNQRGHGPNAQMLGYLGEDGWYKMKEDLKHIVEYAKSNIPDKPCYVLGHSMGSFVVRDFLIDYSYLVNAVILSGTGFPPSLPIKFGKWLASNDMKKHGPKHINTFIDKMVFGNYNKKIESPKTPFDWLSRDSEIVNDYIQNPYCGVIHPSSFFYLFFSAIQRITQSIPFNNFKPSIPMLLISGDSDPVGDYGKGVKKSAEFYKTIGFNAEVKLFKDGRHEMLNEINRVEVFETISDWLLKQSTSD